MKRNSMLLCVLAAALLLSLTGCQLAKPDGEAAQGQDRLVGVYLTTEYLDLFDIDSYFSDNSGKITGGLINEEESRAYQGRLYAALQLRTTVNDDGETVLSREYVFEGLDGIGFFAPTIPATETENSYVCSAIDEGISGGQRHFIYTDEEDAMELEGTVYVAAQSPQWQGAVSTYFNPVYQTADGQVYLMSGSGISTDSTGSGSIYSQTMDEERTVTENGTAKTQRTSVKVSVAVMDVPEEIVLLAMDEDSRVLTRERFSPENRPESLTIPAGTAYVVVETHSGDGVSRELLDRESGTLETYRCREDGICVPQYTELCWESE